MNILVTGGAGFIGSNLVHQLLQEASGDAALPVTKVINLDALTYAGNPANLAALEGDRRHHFVHGDICDTPLVRQLLGTHDIDAVMHLAAETHVDRSIESAERFVQTNVVGTSHLLQAFLDHSIATGRNQSPPDSTVGRFLHVSTDEVFGSLGPEDPPFDETSPYAPNSPYSASKAGSDHLARAFFQTHGLPVITVNSSNNYGPRQFPEKLIPLMIQKLLKAEPLPVYGDGTQIRDWLFVDDQCRGLTRALIKGIPGERYCLGGRCEKRNIEVVRELISAIQELAPDSPAAGKDPEELISFVTDRPGHDQRYAMNIGKSKTELGWEPQEPFRSGLVKTVQWYLDHQAWVEASEDPGEAS